MLKKRVKYVDYNGKEQEDTLYFNLNEVEAVRLDAEFPGGLETYIQKLVDEENVYLIMSLFERVLQTAYGEKSEDGKHFLKSEERTRLFIQSAPYSALFFELATDAEKASLFVNALLSRTVIETKEQA